MFGFEGENAREKGIVLLTMCFALAMAMLDNTVVNVALPTHPAGSGRRLLRAPVGRRRLRARVRLAAAHRRDPGRPIRPQADVPYRPRRLHVVLVRVRLSHIPRSSSIIARAFQGVGGALLIPGTLSIITVTFPPRERAKALGIWAGVSGIALALGPTLGGYIVEHLGWEYVFFLNVPIGIVAFFVATSTVTESVSQEERKLDVARPRPRHGRARSS